MIWFLGILFFSIFTGVLFSYVSGALVLLAGLLGISQRRWWPPKIGVEFGFLLWVAAAVTSYAYRFGLDTNAWIRLADFHWLILFYTILFVVIRARFDEGLGVFIFAATMGISLWTFAVRYFGIDLQILDFGLDLYQPRLTLDTLVQVLAVFSSFLFGMSIIGVRFPNKLRFLLPLATLSAISAVFYCQQFSAAFVMLISLFILSVIFSFRFGFAITMPAILAVIGFHPENFLSALPIRSVVDFIANFRGNWIIGEGYGSSQEAAHQLGILRILQETGVVGGLAFLLVVFGFLRIAGATWRVVSDRNVFVKAMALGLLGAQICLLLLNFLGLGFCDVSLRYLTLIVWALTIWLAIETRVLRQGI